MDVHKALADLYEEKRRLDSAIGALEVKLSTPVKAVRSRGRRGRRSMSAKEREEVSLRMSRYWASRRAAQPADSSHPNPLPINGVTNLQMVREGV